MAVDLRWLLVIALGALLVACGKAEVTPTPTPSSPAQASTVAPGETPPPVSAAIRVAQHPELGAILTDGAGHTLYLFTSDERGVSTCYQGCAAAWPPLLTVDDPIAGDGADAFVIGTTTRDDGTTQVTYNGWPLYRFAADETPSNAMGQNVGGIWFAVSTSGGPIQTEALVKVATHAELGTILSDASGRTLYLFTVDERNKSNCLSGCATAWPPMVTVGEPIAGEGISAGRLGSIEREGGYFQVTYNGWPLYYFAPDSVPGDALGQNSGDIWFVVSTDGGPIQNNAIVKTSGHPDLGTILVDASGRTLYLLTDDGRDSSTCTRGCALAWPPVRTVGHPSAGEGVDADRLGVIPREDGSSQVTYNGWPLYYFAPDERPGDAMGHFVGDVWYVVTPSGEAQAIPPPTPDKEMDHPTAVSTPTPTAVSEATPVSTTATSTPAPVTIPPSDATPAPTEGRSQEIPEEMTPTPVPEETPTSTTATITPTPTATTTPNPTPTPVATATPVATPTPAEIRRLEIQDVAVIENYAGGQFYPPTVVVIKDVPLNLYITRLFREHVNQFHILPFLRSTNFFPPGSTGVERFTPDESGEFRMVNLGHGHQGSFIVVDSVEDAKSYRAEVGGQEFALIHDLESGTISPDTIVVQRGIPLRIYNYSLRGSAKVSIEPFYTAKEDNIRSGAVTTLEFIPDVTGEFIIRYEDHDATGTLIVE